MATRPAFIELRSSANSAASSSRLGLPSPRIQHYDGDNPASLSPLDAFAAQSRKLAQELDVAARAGQKRVSRLPPAVVTQSLSQHQAERPHYFRSHSAESELGAAVQDEQSPGHIPEMKHPTVRPVSEYPRLSGVPNLDNEAEGENFFTPGTHPNPAGPHHNANTSDYFAIPRAESPEQSSEKFVSFDGQSITWISDSQDPHNPSDQHQQRASTSISVASQPDVILTFAPPNAAFARPTNHMRIPRASSDDDYASSAAGSTFSQARNLSSSSGLSTPQSPTSSIVVPPERSPSLNSELSARVHHRSRSNLNFSRPISSSSLSNLARELPSGKQSLDSQTFHPYLGVGENPIQRDSIDDAGSEISDGFMSGSAPSYTYAKFSLPRGRLVSRDSSIFQALSAPHFEWQEPMFPSTPPMTANTGRSLATPSPPPALGSTLGSPSDAGRPGQSGFSFEFDTARPKTPDRGIKTSNPYSPTYSALSTTSSAARVSVERGDLRSMRTPPTKQVYSLGKPERAVETSAETQKEVDLGIKKESDDTHSTSSRSNSTLRPQSTRTGSTGYHSMSPEQHVAKGIECHEHGDLKESTYHLRIAAKQNHPTGMLLYALACRHGWGMRANQEEGVRWLRKAVDYAILEVADDENSSNGDQANAPAEKRAHRAQFALSIYELGVSHLNGWGVDQDKALGLRCFEIAGNWGDTDALTEAGFCYAQGIGCKKDLKKAAKFYRIAESKGVSMVGNSW